jgi:hypothetical protein
MELIDGNDLNHYGKVRNGSMVALVRKIRDLDQTSFFEFKDEHSVIIEQEFRDLFEDDELVPGLNLFGRCT